MSAPAWLPDWRDASAYQLASSNAWEFPYVWHWEFLRRRKDYQNDWDRCSAHGDREPLKRFFRDNPGQPGEAAPAPFGSREEYESSFAFMRGSAAVYGIRFLVNPALPSSEYLVGPAMVMLAGKYGNWQKVRHYGLAEDIASDFEEFRKRIGNTQAPVYLLGFDLSWPLPDLVKAAKVALEGQREFHKVPMRSAVRNRVEKWPLYLRVLDAQESGASLATIAKELLRAGDRDVDSQRALAHETIDAARRLQIRLTS